MNSSHLDDPDYGVDYGGDYGIVPYNQTTKTKVKRIKKSRKRKIKILPEEDDDDDQVWLIPTESSLCFFPSHFAISYLSR